MSLLTIGPLRRVRHRSVHGWPARQGSSIRYHTFQIYGHKAKLPDMPGIYIVAKPDAGQWFPLLIGESINLSSHVAKSDRMAEAIEQGATAVHVMEVSGPHERQGIEQELIRSLQPPLNTSAPLRSLMSRFGRRTH